jgi:hypothetical protein
MAKSNDNILMDSQEFRKQAEDRQKRELFTFKDFIDYKKSRENL